MRGRSSVSAQKAGIGHWNFQDFGSKPFQIDGWADMTGKREGGKSGDHPLFPCPTREGLIRSAP